LTAHNRVKAAELRRRENFAGADMLSATSLHQCGIGTRTRWPRQDHGAQDGFPLR
jgi:hypothetical protein